MKPIEYLITQLELEGIRREAYGLISRLHPDTDKFPLILIARMSDGEMINGFDNLFAEEIRSKTSINELQQFRTETAIAVLENGGFRPQANQYKTYIFPENFKSANVDAVKYYNQDDPKIVAFGFNGMAEKVFAIEEHEMIVSACVSSRQNGTSGEAWVFTPPHYRKKGLAQQVVSAWADNVQKVGLIPFYSHKSENTYSAHLAKRLGLTEVFEEMIIEIADFYRRMSAENTPLSPYKSS